MRRSTPHGTPSRASRYLIPSNTRRLVWRSLAVAAVLLAAFGGLYAAGVHRVASPGTLASAHGAIDVQCTQCHQPAKQVVDLRCERCHDPIDARRFESAAHAVRIGALAARTAHETGSACATCHVDHGGRRRNLAQVDDIRCTACHTFGSLSKHPEFALVRAGRDESAGLNFPHEVHLREVAKIGTDRCLSCHMQTPDQRGFEPISFDTHCAKCHVINNTLSTNGREPVKSGWTPAAALPPAAGTGPTRGTPDERGRVILARFTHRDPWTLVAAERLTRAIEGAAAVPAHSAAEVEARLTALTRSIPLASLADADLQTWLPILDREVAALDRAIAAGPTAPPDPTAGLESLTAVDPSLGPLLNQIRG